MIKPIMTKRFFLRQPSEPATADDLAVAQDLVDTLEAHRTTCVGMAANMIGERKRIIAIVRGPVVAVMLNPVILEGSGEYETEEGCLSLEGVRKTKRCRSIKLQYSDIDLKTKIKTFKDFEAQIIQHEMDHFEGILI